MKILKKIINILLLIFLGFLLLGLITSENYSDVIFVAPIFFKHLVIFFIVIISIFFLTYALRNSESKYNGIWIEFISISILAFVLSYFSNPKVKEHYLFQKVVEYRFDQDAYNEIKDLHEKNNSLDYFYFLDREVKMFREIYQNQFDYLKEKNKKDNPYWDPQFLFFLTLGILLLLNGIYDLSKKP